NNIKLMILVVFAFVCSLHAVNTNRPSILPLDYYPEIARSFVSQFPNSHLSKYPVNDLISSRGWTNYLNSYDYNHVYFLQSDIDEFAKYMYDLDDTLKVGNLDFAYMVFNVFKERLANRYEYVEQLLTNGFEFVDDEYWCWKRHDAPWPKDQEDSDDIWRRKIKNEYLASVVSKELREEKSTNVMDVVEIEAGDDVLDNGTNVAVTVSNVVDDIKAPTIEEIILNKYKQYLTVINDSDSEYVLQKYLTSFAMAYDPHSSYMAPSSYEDFSIEMNLSLVGIGAMLRSEDGMAKIVSIIPGGPADRDKRASQLAPGDKIIAVAQGDEPAVSILHWPINKAVKLIRGKKNSRVVLTVIPADDPTDTTTKIVDLIRDEVKLEEQAASMEKVYEVSENGVSNVVGVIKVPAFYAPMGVSQDVTKRTVSQDVEKLVEEFLQEEHPAGLILDLRNNGGGSLLEAINLTGLFIEKGPVVQVRETYNVSALRDRDPSIVYDGPMIVLVNKLSASASEIFAGALQDYGRALIVGDKKTHGKGTVQTILKMGNEKLGRIKVTTASFYRISGDSTQLRGVIPDIIMPSYLDYMDLGEDQLDNPLEWTQIRPAKYSTETNVSLMVNDLIQKSTERTEYDEKFQDFLVLLARAKEIQEVVELPLNKDARKALSRREDEMKEVKNKNLGAEFVEEEAVAVEEESLKGDKENNVKLTSDIDDPILKESICILYDMIDISSEKDYFIRKQLEAKKMAEKTDEKESSIKSFIVGIVSWIKNVWLWITKNIFRI
ncbi:MAG: carboxy terminal-processing peptidase, partial [Kiritimatiellae bacterium]|nr:carboxy terminal-processing peptidase [Kiritimatiellia bacterium]